MPNLRHWQLFDEQGRPLPGKSAAPKEIFNKTLLHAAAHLWIWRNSPKGPELLLQQRSIHVKNFPGLLDISAAGHVDADEDPLTTALREAREELGLALAPETLRAIGVQRSFIQINSGVNTGKIENEFRFMYLHELNEKTELTFGDGEVHAAKWIALTRIQADLAGPNAKLYVPHPAAYYATLFTALADYQKMGEHAGAKRY